MNFVLLTKSFTWLWIFCQLNCIKCCDFRDTICRKFKPTHAERNTQLELKNDDVRRYDRWWPELDCKISHPSVYRSHHDSKSFLPSPNLQSHESAAASATLEHLGWGSKPRLAGNYIMLFLRHFRVLMGLWHWVSAQSFLLLSFFFSPHAIVCKKKKHFWELWSFITSFSYQIAGAFAFANSLYHYSSKSISNDHLNNKQQ